MVVVGLRRTPSSGVGKDNWKSGGGLRSVLLTMWADPPILVLFALAVSLCSHYQFLFVSFIS